MEPLFNKILETIQKNNGCVVATVVASRGSSPRKLGAKMVISKDGSIFGTIGGGALEKLVMDDGRKAFAQGKSFLKSYSLDKKSGLQICGGRVSIFFEVVRPARRLVIAGGGHIGLALSFMGKLLGFDIVLIDNRRAFASKQRFFHADQIICDSYQKALKRVAPDKNTYIVIVTHGHLYDQECLEASLKSSAGYIGMIGSAIKIRNIFDALLKKGFKSQSFKRVYSPVGLDIGAETPEEIAVAIVAQLVQVYREDTCLPVGREDRR
jgi:xanthine dehydrogenase accessory factor